MMTSYKLKLTIHVRLNLRYQKSVKNIVRLTLLVTAEGKSNTGTVIRVIGNEVH